MFHVSVFSDAARLNLAAYEVVVGVMHGNAQPVLGLATGSTPLGLYEALRTGCARGTLSFRSTVTFNLDEYMGIPSVHPESYHTFMYRNLFDAVDILPENIHLPCGDGSIADPCVAYETELSARQIDLQLLGIGSNGHIGFNEPGTPFGQGVHIVDLQPSTIHDNARFFASTADVPTQAITMGSRNILQARRILLLASGIQKAEAVRAMLTGSVTEALPASVLQLHPDVTVLLDQGAASLLPASVTHTVKWK